MPFRWYHTLLFLAALAAAAAFRVPRLDLRPMHGDEANQAIKTGILLETGRYEYDPFEHHGPTLYYFTLPILRLCGVHTIEDCTEPMLRALPVIFGIATVALLWLLRDALGPWATVWAALFLAISNALVYYSRYYVQETLLVCFTLGALAFGWRYLRRPCFGWAVCTGLCIGLMHATKETCVVLFAAIAAALALECMLAWRAGRLPRLRRIHAGHVAVAVFAAAVVSLTLFSSFCTHARGPLDSILTYTSYLHRAEGAGSAALHDKPWHYYLTLLAYTYHGEGPRWTEGLLLGACRRGHAGSGDTGAGAQKSCACLRGSRQRRNAAPARCNSSVSLPFMRCWLLRCSPQFRTRRRGMRCRC